MNNIKDIQSASIKRVEKMQGALQAVRDMSVKLKRLEKEFWHDPTSLPDEVCQHIWKNASKEFPVFMDTPVGRQIMAWIRRCNRESAFRGKSVQICNKEKAFGDHVKSMHDGKVYTSRRKYEAEIKAHGYDLVGNDRKTMTDKIREKGNKHQVATPKREHFSKELGERVMSTS
jgi:hypothetical protein